MDLLIAIATTIFGLIVFSFGVVVVEYEMEQRKIERMKKELLESELYSDQIARMIISELKTGAMK